MIKLSIELLEKTIVSLSKNEDEEEFKLILEEFVSNKKIQKEVENEFKRSIKVKHSINANKNILEYKNELSQLRRGNGCNTQNTRLIRDSARVVYDMKRRVIEEYLDSVDAHDYCECPYCNGDRCSHCSNSGILHRKQANHYYDMLSFRENMESETKEYINKQWGL